MGAQAQNAYDAYRTNTWSVYAQGGVSFATGGDMLKNTNTVRGVEIAPFVGGGVNYNIRPWVRLGLNYAFSKYQREQRLSQIEADGTAYRDQRMLYHDVDLTGEFNILELWPSRQNKRLNIYLGTGFGCMFAKGSAYDIRMGTVETDKSTSTRDDITWQAWLKAKNSHSYGNSFYIPARLNVEYDLSPNWTIGAKGECNFLLKKRDYLPAQTELAGVLVRYNFVPGNGKKDKEKIKELLNQYDALQQQNDALNERNRQLAQDLDDANRQKDDLQKQLRDCEESKKANEVMRRDIIFSVNNAEVAKDEMAKVDDIVRYLNDNPSATVAVTGYADAGTGNADVNAKISQKRADVVKQALISAGIAANRITTDSKGDKVQPFAENDRNRVTICIAE